MRKPDGHAVNNSNSGREILRSAIYTMKSELKKKKKLRFKEWLNERELPGVIIDGSPIHVSEKQELFHDNKYIGKVSMQTPFALGNDMQRIDKPRPTAVLIRSYEMYSKEINA